jgi:nucleoside-diphosphate-sugar epimerase
MATPTVLITGATGFLGGATLVELLRARPDCRVLALVRAPDEQEGRARIDRSLARFDEPDRASVRANGIDVVCAELAAPESLADPRLAQATHVLHAAANTSFRSVRAVRRVNILGTLALAHRLRRMCRLQRFLHVGTAFSCGLQPMDSLIHEDDYPRDDARHLVEYTSAKAEAETLLEATAPELPLVIARPSVVIGHSRLGTRPSASIFWYYRTVDLLRRVMWPMTAREDIIPVDHAAEALVALLMKPQLQHRRYHVSAGLGASSSWNDIAAAFARHHGERGDDPYRRVAWDTIVEERRRLAPRLGEGDEERMLMALALYYRFPNLVFDNTRLLGEGVRAPPRFADYLDRCMTDPGGRSVYDQMTDDD